MERLRCAIVGGGVHGVYLANRLLSETPVEPSELAIFDPNEQLLGSFRRQASACGMDTLRSSYVHHVGTEPFSLESYAEATDREDELVETVDYPARPTRSLFLDHADHIIERADLDERHRSVAVTDAEYAADTTESADISIVLETDHGPVAADACILAVGTADQRTIPEWATGVDGIRHIWGEYDRAEPFEQKVVVRGGITAGQLATSIAGRSVGDEKTSVEHVRLLTRSAIEWKITEAPPPWLNWDRIERDLHEHPPASRQRYELVNDIRNDGTMPPYLYDEIETCRNDGVFGLVDGTVESARQTGDRVELHLDRGDRLLADQVVLATGFEQPFAAPLVERLAGSLQLDRGYAGMPVLSDETLAWRRIDGSDPPLYVTGAAALCTVGPFAPNIVGARRSADKIIPALRRQWTREPPRATK